MTPNHSHFLRRLMQTNDVVFLGDSEHANPAVKGAMVDMLPALKAGGGTELWLEIAAEKRPSLMQFLAKPHTEEDVIAFCQGPLGIRHGEAIGRLIHQGQQQGLRIEFFDNKAAPNRVREQYPEFRELHRQADAAFHDGGPAAEKAFLDEMPAETHARYDAAYVEWKQARKDVNPEIAARIRQRLQEAPGTKIIAVIGQSHLARPDDLDDQLMQAGVKVGQVDVYRDEQAYRNFLQRDDELGRPGKQTAQLVYYTDTKTLQSGELVLPKPYQRQQAVNWTQSLLQEPAASAGRHA